jgi:hypothetical protein
MVLCAAGKYISRQQVAAVVTLVFGIAVATVSEMQVAGNPVGIMTAAAAVLSTALCQVWAGAKQKELQANGEECSACRCQQQVTMPAATTRHMPGMNCMSTVTRLHTHRVSCAQRQSHSSEAMLG